MSPKMSKFLEKNGGDRPNYLTLDYLFLPLEMPQHHFTNIGKISYRTLFGFHREYTGHICWKRTSLLSSSPVDATKEEILFIQILIHKQRRTSKPYYWLCFRLPYQSNKKKMECHIPLPSNLHLKMLLLQIKEKIRIGNEECRDKREAPNDLFIRLFR